MLVDSEVDEPKVAILLCTYYGEDYLAEQLDSIDAQTHTNWEVWASDDGSLDDTHAILEAYKQEWPEGRLSIHSAGNADFAANFLSLTRKTNIDADYCAYSDQDDIWEPNRLERALDWLKTIPPHIPALYSSRTSYISKDRSDLGFSTIFKKKPSFRNALVQSIAGGNTMVFNKSAHLLLARTPSHVKVVSHDWWAYMLVCGCGGKVFYDKYPSVRYRQHGNNIAGQNKSLLARVYRAKSLLAGRFQNWNQLNIDALCEMEHCLTNENRETLNLFKKARKGSIFARIYNLYLSGVYRQTVAGDVGMLIAALLGKL